MDPTAVQTTDRPRRPGTAPGPRPGAPSNIDRLRSLYASPGPYVSAFFRRFELDRSPASPLQRFNDQRPVLEAAGASSDALDALAARLSLPVENDVGGQALIAADDGSTAVATSHEGPAHDHFVVGALPYSAPLIEWDQWEVDHLAVLVVPDEIEVVSFVSGEEPSVRPAGRTIAEAVDTLSRMTRETPLDFIALAGSETDRHALARALRGVVPARTEIVELDESEASTIDAMSDALVRMVADRVARQTVSRLQEFRFLRSHDEAVDGACPVLEALRTGRGRLLLVHDDPDDERRAWFGTAARSVSENQTSECPFEGRLVDVLIRSAILQGVDVRVVPSTGETGPADDLACFLDVSAVPSS